MVNNHFDVALKIAAFRGIAGQLHENNLITQDEFNAIQRNLKKQERLLIIGCHHGKSHERKICPKDQA